jgi:hypothetical protein
MDQAGGTGARDGNSGKGQAAKELPMDEVSAGAGESQGGAYTNPHDGKSKGKKKGGGLGGFLGHGGQSDQGYEGGDNPNATTKE